MKLNKRRRREGKTNYPKRLALLKSKLPRLIVRKTNRYLILQIVESENAQDKILYGVNTKELLKFGWPEDKKGSLKSLAAAYLGGLLLGNKSKGLKEEVILDTGLIPNTKGSRIYAGMKGFSDSGKKIKYDKKIMPEENKIKNSGKINEEIFNKVKGVIGKKQYGKK